jgi:hypothetical protein
MMKSSCVSAAFWFDLPMRRELVVGTRLLQFSEFILY